MITKQDLINFFDVYPDSGKFIWKNVSKHHNRLNGQEAGCSADANGKPYWNIKINNKRYKRGRLMFLFVYSRFPNPCVDHINGNSLDDSIKNLREATILENAWNRKKIKRTIDLPMGVRNTLNGKFQARISFKGKQLHLGVFKTADEAKAVYEQKRKELYGKFSGY
jgi:hypothetical protein